MLIKFSLAHRAGDNLRKVIYQSQRILHRFVRRGYWPCVSCVHELVLRCDHMVDICILCSNSRTCAPGCGREQAWIIGRISGRVLVIVTCRSPLPSEFKTDWAIQFILLQGIKKLLRQFLTDLSALNFKESRGCSDFKNYTWLTRDSLKRGEEDIFFFIRILRKYGLYFEELEESR